MSKQRLIFTKYTKRTYSIKNQKEELIGFVERIRTGRFMHYCLTIPFTLMEECVNRSEGLIFSPGCQDEIRVFCKKLNGLINLNPESVCEAKNEKTV